MNADVVIQVFTLWISRYIAVFCLLTLLAWAGGAYLLTEKWEKIVRDSAVYLVTIGLLSLVLFLQPVNSDVIFWPPLSWFCVAMLMVMELFWVTYLVDAALRFLRKVPERISQELIGTQPPSRIQHLRK